MRKQAVALCVTSGLLIGGYSQPSKADTLGVLSVIAAAIAAAIAVDVVRHPASAAPVVMTHHGKTTSAGLNVRSCAGVTCSSLNPDDPLLPGTVVTLNGPAEGLWIPVTARTQRSSYTGYASGKFISFVD